MNDEFNKVTSDAESGITKDSTIADVVSSAVNAASETNAAQQQPSYSQQAQGYQPQNPYAQQSTQGYSQQMPYGGQQTYSQPQGYPQQQPYTTAQQGYPQQQGYAQPGYPQANPYAQQGAQGYQPQSYTTGYYQYNPTATVATATNDGFAVASLILSIVGIVTCCTFVPSLLGLIFGIVSKAKNDGTRPTGVSTAGIILGVIGLLLSVFWLVVFLSADASGLN